jgi:Flp pilus assembly protein TadD
MRIWSINWLLNLFLLTQLSTGCAPQILYPTPEEGYQASGLIDKGTMLLRAGDYVAARSAFQVSYELVPSANALDGLGCVELQLENYEKADTYFARAMEFDPAYIQVLGNRALLYEKMGKITEAEAYFRKAVELAPSNMPIRNNFGVLLSHQGKNKLAIEQFRAGQIIEEHPFVNANLEYESAAGSERKINIE